MAEAKDAATSKTQGKAEQEMLRLKDDMDHEIGLLKKHAGEEKAFLESRLSEKDREFEASRASTCAPTTTL